MIMHMFMVVYTLEIQSIDYLLDWLIYPIWDYLRQTSVYL